MVQSRCANVTLTAYTLMDAQQLHIEYPDTFGVPPDALLDALKPGSIVKICAEFDPERMLTNVTPIARAQWARKVGAESADNTDGERFWTIITAVDGDGPEPTFTATIDNDLIYSAHHGLGCGDTVTFARRHILQVYED